MVTWRRRSGRIERMSGDAATVGYTHPIVNAVADLETILDGCADARLWSLSVKELDDLLPQCHGEERVRVMGAGARVPLVAVTGCDRVGVVVVWWWGRDTPGSGAGV